MLALKLIVVPVFLALVSLAARRWGPGFAGWLAGFPLITGPVLFFMSLEQDAGFVAQAAAAALSAVAAAASFVLAYSWACLRAGWPLSLLAGLAAWMAMALLLALLPASPVASLAAALAALLAAPYLFPAPAPVPARNELPRSELLLRMAAGAVMTVLVTGLAASIGPVWSGLLSMLPVLATVLAVFSHKANGAAFASALLRAMISGFYALIAFAFAVALLLPGQGVATTFAAAVALALCAGEVARRVPALPQRRGAANRAG